MTQPIAISHPQNRFVNLLRSVPIQCVGCALFFWLYHKFLIYSMRNLSINLGAVKFSRHAVPLYAVPEIYLSWWILPAFILLVGFLLLCRKFVLQGSIRLRWGLLIAIACFIAIGISVAQIDGYREIDGERLPASLESYTREGNEYYGDVPKVDEFGFRTFLRDYAKPEVFKTLSGHGQTHPPGGALFLWIVSKIFGYNLLSASLATILFTSLTVIPITLLAKDLYGESVSRYALALFLIAPNFVMFTTTSMDGPFSVFPIVSVYLFYKAIRSDRTVLFYAILTGIALALGMLMTYATVFIGVFIGSVGLLTLITARAQFKHLLKVILIAAGAFAVFYLLMFLLTGFNLPEAIWTSVQKDETGMGTGYETIGRYFHLSFANLFAFLIGIGIPLTAVWIRQIVATIRRARNGDVLDIYVVGYVIALLAITFSTLFTMEVERIWIFMAPFIVIPVAKYLHERCEQRQRMADFYWVAGLLCLQLILFEVTLYTYW